MFTEKLTGHCRTVRSTVFAFAVLLAVLFYSHGDIAAAEEKIRIFISCDGNTQEFYTAPITAEVALQRAGIELGRDDLVKVNAAEAFGHEVQPEELLEVIRVENHDIQHERDLTPDEQQQRGTGVPGKAIDTTRIVYHNGMEVQRFVVSTQLVDAPALPTVVQQPAAGAVSRGGAAPVNYRKVFRMTATAYTHTGNNTATGVYPRLGTVAVDPRVIPLGSKLYVEGYGYGRAEDTGGAIKGQRIDVFLDTNRECIQWGRRPVTVYLLP